MPISHTSPYRRHVFGAVVACLAGVAGIAARQQGWLGGTTDPDPFAASADVPPPDEELLQMPTDIEIAQSGPEEFLTDPELAPTPTPVRNKARTSQWETSSSFVLERDDGLEKRPSALPKSRSKSRVVAAGFEDEAPPAPDEDGTSNRAPSKRVPAAIARKAADSAKAAILQDPSETDQPKKLGMLNGDKIQSLIDDGNYIDAQKELSQWYWNKPETREQILPQLNKLARALYFSPQPQYFDPYVVKPGDQLRVVGQRYKLSWEYIARLNHVEAKRIRMGQKLKVVPGPFAAIVFLDRYELVVHLNGSFVKSYRVGVGKDGTTPVGTFTVKNKMVDPTYYGPEGVVAHDDPKNPLGERWIDIGDSYGIHGTIEPESIGKNESRGCIRMLNSDVEEVYDFLVIGSEVKIVRK